MPITLLQGDDLPCNIFSSLGEYGLPILEYLTYKDGNALRATCKEARKAVEEHKLMDSKTHIKGSLQKWRICFRNAKAVNISGRKDLKDDDFVHLKGIHTLYMWGCNQATITDAPINYLIGTTNLFYDTSYYEDDDDKDKSNSSSNNKASPFGSVYERMLC